MSILAAPNCPLGGEYEGAALLDIAPTLFDLAATTFQKQCRDDRWWRIWERRVLATILAMTKRLSMIDSQG